MMQKVTKRFLSRIKGSDAFMEKQKTNAHANERMVFLTEKVFFMVGVVIKKVGYVKDN